jgi:hypothetical protein
MPDPLLAWKMEPGSPGGGLTQETRTEGISFGGEQYRLRKKRYDASRSESAPLKERWNIAGALGNGYDFNALTP